MGISHGSGTVLESLSLKAGGEALSQQRSTVLSCGGIALPYNHIPSKPLRWKDIMDMPGTELSQRIFGLEPVIYQWNPYSEEAVYEN